MANATIDPALDPRYEERGGLFNYPLVLKIVLSVLALSLFFFAVFGRDAQFDSLFKPIDIRAETYLEKTMKDAAITFGVVRGIHALIAIFKGTQINPPFATLAVGEALDPVQDLIERFSDALVLAIASLGAQRFLMEIGQMIGVSLFAGAGAAMVFVGMWIRGWRDFLLLWGARLIVFGFAVRLIIPLLAYGADLTREALLAQQFAEASAQIEFDSAAIADTRLPSDEEQGFFDKLKSYASAEAFKQKIEEFQLKCENLATSTIQLFTLFVFQTLIFPILSFWLLVKLFGGFLPRGR